MLKDTQINDVQRFMNACGQNTETFDVRQTALYVGLVIEEAAEMLGALGLDAAAHTLTTMSNGFKRGDYDNYVKHCDREALLDSHIDSVWVHLGAAFSQGANVVGAWHTVAQSNLSKIDPDGSVTRDGNGKIMKPKNWVAPDLRPHVGR